MVFTEQHHVASEFNSCPHNATVDEDTDELQLHQPQPQTAFIRDVRNGTNHGSRNANHSPSSFVAGRCNHTQPVKPRNEVVRIGSDVSGTFLKGDNPAGKVSTFTKHTQGFFLPNRQAVNHGHGYGRFKLGERGRRKEESKASNELACGPRSRISCSGSVAAIAKTQDLGCRVFREEYNKSDFQNDYEDSKFYVIKSYSEDDIHKSIKYNVWTSTPKGNRKLDTAFHEAEATSVETGIKCPIFLFFSVNGSGQFVGIAEMIGPVDFNKDMDFWQAEKWSGFFPVKWHIIKDVSNSHLRHIVLHNNDGCDVTFTRDTHEVGVKQGLEMLNIFKSYVAKTSLLDDFKYYENREKSLCKKRCSSKPETYGDVSYNNNLVLTEIETEMHGNGNGNSVERSLEDLTNNFCLDLNDYPV